MLVPCDREGVFRCSVEAYGLKELPSGSVAVSLQVKLLEWFGAMHQGDEPGWHDWSAYNMGAEGDIWIVGNKDNGNKLLESGVNSLVRHGGWDGDFGSIVGDTWQPTPFSVVTQADKDKNGNIKAGQFRIAFVNDYSHVPGQLTRITPEAAVALASRYGAQMRALAGNARRNAAPATSRPSAPPPPVATGALKPPPSNGDNSEDIPF
jgi:hypothetical protein